MKRSRLPRARRAFTLMEMLLVLGIIGLLIGAGTVGLRSAMSEGKRTTTIARIGKIDGFIMIFQNRHQGKLPSSAAGIRVLLNEKIIEDEDDLKDAWGNDLIYVYPARRSAKTKYDIFSKGPDEVEGNEDDIGNWTK